jgi:hypothetical protein
MSVQFVSYLLGFSCIAKHSANSAAEVAELLAAIPPIPVEMGLSKCKFRRCPVARFMTI